MEKKKVIIFGAGQIGRGFIGDFCSEENYYLIFVDIDKSLIELLNKRKSYPLWILGKKKIVKKISNLKGIYFEETEKISDEIVDTPLIFTAVGANNLKNLASVIALGIQKKFYKNSKSFLNVIICENLLGSSKILYSEISKKLSMDIQKYLKENVGFVETVVSRMVAPITEELKKTNPLLVRVESYNILPVDRKAFKGGIPKIKSFYPVDNLSQYEELKLFGHNLIHATVAYLGYLKGYNYIWEGMEDREILEVLDGIIQEIKYAFIKKYKFSTKKIENYFYDLKKRFKNKLLEDTVYRVGREPIRKLGPKDRIIGAINFCLSQKIFPKNICLVASACLCYNYQLDFEALKLQKFLKNKGVDFVLKNICKLKETRVYNLIKEKYEELKRFREAGKTVPGK